MLSICFVGAATSCLAALQCNRLWIGSEIDTKCHRYAHKRIIDVLVDRIGRGQQVGAMPLDHAEFTSIAMERMLPLGTDNFPSPKPTLQQEAKQYGLKIKKSKHSGVQGRMLGRGVVSPKGVQKNSTICFIWGSFQSGNEAKSIANSEAAISFKNAALENVVMIVDKECVGRYINDHKGTNLSANAVMVEQQLVSDCPIYLHLSQ